MKRFQYKRMPFIPGFYFLVGSIHKVILQADGSEILIFSLPDIKGNLKINRQKQPSDVFYEKRSSGGVLQKRCSLIFCKIHRKMPVPESLSCNFIKKETLARCLPVNFAKFLRTSFLQNTSGRLLLHWQYFSWQYAIWRIIYPKQTYG